MPSTSALPVSDRTELAPATHDQVEHAVRQPGATQDVDELPRAARHELRRLEDHGVAVGEGRGDLPGGDRDGEVPRRDDADHAERLAGHRHLESRSDRVDHLTGVAQRLTAVELQDLPGPHHLAARLGQGLALFAGEQVTELVGTRTTSSPARSRTSARSCGVANAHRGSACSGRADRRLGIGCVAVRVLADDVRGVTGVDVGRPAVTGDSAPPMMLGRGALRHCSQSCSERRPTASGAASPAHSQQRPHASAASTDHDERWRHLQRSVDQRPRVSTPRSRSSATHAGTTAASSRQCCRVDLDGSEQPDTGAHLADQRMVGELGEASRSAPARGRAPAPTSPSRSMSRGWPVAAAAGNGVARVGVAVTPARRRSRSRTVRSPTARPGPPPWGRSRSSVPWR